MKSLRLTHNIKSTEKPTVMEFDPGKNVKCFVGETGSGKSAFVSALMLCLFGTCFIDSKGGYVKDGRELRKRLNAYQDIHVEYEHAKGTTNVDIVETQYGTVPKSWQKGFSFPDSANVAADIKAIFSYGEDKASRELVKFVVKNVTSKDIKDKLSPEALAVIDVFLKKKTLTPVEALDSALEKLSKDINAKNAELKTVQASADVSARMPSPMQVEENLRDLAFWRNSKAAAETWHRAQHRDDSAVKEVVSAISALNSQITAYQIERDMLPAVNEDKVKAYEAARVLAQWCSENDIPCCPMCGDTTPRDRAFYKQLVVNFEGGIYAEQNDPNVIKAAQLSKKIQDALKEVQRKEVELGILNTHVVVGAKPNYDVKECDAKIEDLEKVKSQFTVMETRYEQEQARQKKEMALISLITSLKETHKALTAKKKSLVKLRFDLFLEKARYFMPDPNYTRGGVLHINIEKREIGFLRNGKLQLDPSGSEFRAIVTAMALAACSSYAVKPTVFLDDVGWGKAFLEACLNAWTKYEGEVIVQSTMMPRSSQLNGKVEIINCDEIAHHTKVEVEAVEVQDTTAFVLRPEDFETSMFRVALEDVEVGTKVLMTTKVRKGRSFVDQNYKCIVTNANGKNITAMTEDGVPFTVEVASGANPYDSHITITGIDEDVYAQRLRNSLSQFLGYPKPVRMDIPTMEKVWQNMISAEDFEDRRHLLT